MKTFAQCLAAILLALLASSTVLALDAKPKAKAVLASPAPPAATAPAKGSAAIRELDWEDLVPDESRNRIGGGAPAPMHDYLGESGMAAQQVLDFSVNRTLDGSSVKLPGFIVPLDMGKDVLVTEFFLVPYMGACIHVPPPPPNQIVYVKVPKGLALESIWEAYWITGKLTVQNHSSRLGAAAYQLTADKVEIYKF